MASASITLRGRFRPGTEVRLVRVQSEAALRAEGGEEVGTETVDDDGCVSFSKGVKDGERYFIVGQVDGTHLEVRARGREDESDSILGQAPPALVETRYADGTLVSDDPPEQDLPELEAAPDLSQQQTPEGTQQRSDTQRGTAHPVDPESDFAPYPRQDQLEGRGKLGQMADDGEDVGGGMATPTDVGPQRQEDVPDGTPQRSDTPTGYATVIPSPPVEAQQMKESAEAKVKRGDRGKAATYPIGGDPVTGASPKDSAERHEETLRTSRRRRRRPARCLRRRRTWMTRRAGTRWGSPRMRTPRARRVWSRRTSPPRPSTSAVGGTRSNRVALEEIWELRERLRTDTAFWAAHAAWILMSAKGRCGCWRGRGRRGRRRRRRT